jgi:uncharacterized protein HemX
MSFNELDYINKDLSKEIKQYKCDYEQIIIKLNNYKNQVNELENINKKNFAENDNINKKLFDTNEKYQILSKEFD